MNKTNKKQLNIAYSIKIPFGKTLHVKESANAWWMDRDKLDKLILAFRLLSTIEDACAYAGMSVKQYKYFVQEHPDFNEARKGYKSEIILKAKQTIAKAIHGGDKKMAMKLLEKREPETFGRRSRRQEGYNTPAYKLDIFNYNQLTPKEYKAIQILEEEKNKRINEKI